MTDDGLPPLRDVIASHGLGANKALGQNFLFDLNLTRRIARAAAPLAGFTIVEIGPGPGGLTRALLAEGAERIIAVERDERALPALAEIADAYPGKLQVIPADALAVDWRAVVSGTAKLVANLPYNIATPLLIGWLGDPWPPWYQSMTLMFQREVADRITAKPGTDSYGRLSVICQWRCKVTKLFDIHRSAFTPPPKVTSSVVQFLPRPQCEPDCRMETLERVTAAAFGQRRKMLRSSLKSLGRDTQALLTNAGISEELRAENLTVAEFGRLAQLLDDVA
ncbi:MAG: 16S rRNA (adenine(1518)-N(6)/adenine(1519)-N(6))-dimethyltransferase RsmA [Hyphomicrobiales bacterium]